MRTVYQFYLQNKKLVLVAFLLQALFFAYYFSLSITLEKTQIFNEFDLLFELDPPRAIADLADFHGDHYRTTVHPIYVLLTNPGGSLLSLIVGSKMKAALMLNAFWGALGVVLAFLFFHSFSKQLMPSLLLALLFGLSMAQVLLSAIPDTASLAVCSLIFTYILFLKGLQKKEIWYKWWIVAGILSFGVTITNFAQTAICFAILVYTLQEDKSKLWQLAWKYLRYGLWVVGLSVVLAGLQKLIYPSAGLFFLPNALLDEKDFSTFLIFDHPLLVIQQEIKHFFLVNIVAPYPDTYFMPNQDAPAITFSTSWNYTVVGWIALAVWLAVLVIGVLASWGVKNLQAFFLGLALCLLFNAALHSVYGGGEKEGVVEYFLYSGNFTFLVLAFLSPLGLSKNRWIPFLILAAVVLVGLSNWMVFWGIVGGY